MCMGIRFSIHGVARCAGEYVAEAFQFRRFSPTLTLGKQLTSSNESKQGRTSHFKALAVGDMPNDKGPCETKGSGEASPLGTLAMQRVTTLLSGESMKVCDFAPMGKA
mmetsp:Transcript_82021/g.171677  ORF Transcript_82021/g.171677 Transcript_82021/m.171677 type:complete len:108 (+) Transcript_82021:42-365(+)